VRKLVAVIPGFIVSRGEPDFPGIVAIVKTFCKVLCFGGFSKNCFQFCIGIRILKRSVEPDNLFENVIFSDPLLRIELAQAAHAQQNDED
jgi:hypothetical protein